MENTMNDRIKKTITLFLLGVSLVVSGCDTATNDTADGKLILLEIRLDDRPMATAVWPEKVGAEPDNLWPHLESYFMALREVMPKPAKGTTVTLEGHVVIRLRWPSGEILDTLQLDQLTLAYATPDPAFPKQTRWHLRDEETERIRKVFANKQAGKRASKQLLPTRGCTTTPDPLRS